MKNGISWYVFKTEFIMNHEFVSAIGNMKCPVFVWYQRIHAVSCTYFNFRNHEHSFIYQPHETSCYLDLLIATENLNFTRVSQYAIKYTCVYVLKHKVYNFYIFTYRYTHAYICTVHILNYMFFICHYSIIWCSFISKNSWSIERSKTDSHL